MLKEKMKKAKVYVCEHKREFIIGAGLIVVGGIVFVVTKQKPKTVTVDKILEMNPTIPKLDIGTISDLQVYENGNIDLILNDVKLADLGKVGEELIDKFSTEVSPDTAVTALMGLLVDTAE